MVVGIYKHRKKKKIKKKKFLGLLVLLKEFIFLKKNALNQDVISFVFKALCNYRERHCPKCTKAGLGMSLQREQERGFN